MMVDKFLPMRVEDSAKAHLERKQLLEENLEENRNFSLDFWVGT